MFTSRSALIHKKKLAQKIIKSNEPIHIRNIYVKPETPDFSYGEHSSKVTYGQHISRAIFRRNKYTHIFIYKRFIDHIKLLANIANSAHEKAYGVIDNKEFEIKKDCANKITRLLLNEFSLYTANSPISEEDFGWLIDQIEKIAKQQHENVHLLLSSIPLLTKNGKLLNISLYVECGKTPHIKMISKALASDIDLSYYSRELFSKHSRHIEQVEYTHFSVTDEKDSSIIPTDPVFTITTQGGAQYLQALDICVDHHYEYAKKLTATVISSTSQDTTFIPDQVDHVVCSNTMEIIDSAKISDKISHVDPEREYQYPISSIPLFEAPAIPDEYTETSVEIENNSRMKIKNPPFGASYTLIAAPEKALTPLKRELKEMAVKKNETALGLDIISRSHSMPFEKLFKELLSKCATSFFDRLFEKNNYSIKKNAKNLLIDFQKRINKILLEIVKYDDLVEELNLSLNELKYQLDRLTIHENSFINQLIMKINASQDRLFLPPSLKPAFFMARSRL